MPTMDMEMVGTQARSQFGLAHVGAPTVAGGTSGGVAEVAENRTVAALSPLITVGHHLLADRHVTGPSNAQVGVVVVGPGGVFIIDTRTWESLPTMLRVRTQEDASPRTGVPAQRGPVCWSRLDATDEFAALASSARAVEAECAEVGLAPGEVHPVVVLAGRKGIDEQVGPVRVVGEGDVLQHIAGYGRRLKHAQVAAVLAKAQASFPHDKGRVHDDAAVPAHKSSTVPLPVIPVQRPVPHDDVVGAAPLTPTELEAALAAAAAPAPIETWMSFLHPQQATLVRHGSKGSCHISGAAGTGKTVVGLHRAAYLARTRPGRVLVTTFVRTLPEVMRRAFARLAPDVVDRVDFIAIDRLALRILVDRGVPQNLDLRMADEAFAAVWETAVRGGRLDASRTGDYWREEIDHVIKGRGITQFMQYAELSRVGRRYPVSTEQRHAVWDLYLAYEANLRAAGVHDCADIALMAEKEVRRSPLDEAYSAVIVDEARDLTCVMVRLLHALVGDVPDGLTLISDTQQSVYPGGYRLTEAGVRTGGPGAVLDVNHRNTAQIVAFASGMLAADQASDAESTVACGDPVAAVPRVGPEPVMEVCASRLERTEHMVQRVCAVLTETGTKLGDVGVLCVSHYGVRVAAEALGRAGFPVAYLNAHESRRPDAITVGTIKRAKGLEFSQVLLPDVSVDDLGDTPLPRGGSEREQRALRRSELYVGMTRARDGLWVGIVEGQ